ncbi:FAD-binding protein [Rhodococcus qingshengii]|nr:FAD-binding protein [Rhodococcus qingshengii]
MLSVTEEKAKEWTNWSGSVKSYPASILFPSSIQEVVEIVKAASQQNKKIRVVGAGHSFTRLVQTNEILISLENLHGVEKLDKEKGLAEVWAGTNLKELGEALYELGVSQENLGDINSQSIAGAISTGTHGTGIAFGSISTQVAAITAVNASGEVLYCSDEENPNLFKAFQVSLGTLGIIVKVTLRVVPKLHLSYKCYRTKLTDCLERLVPLKQENRHFEFYWFPYTDTVQVKLMNKTNEASFKNNKWSEWKKLALENGIYWLLSEVCRLLPSMSKTISRISAIGVPSIEESGPSHLLFATPRLVRFNEMEYSIPAEHLRAALEEMKKCIETHQFAVHFPIECRYVKRDDIWLSPANERDSAYIAVHMYKGMSHEEYFYHIEKILQKYEGRPHWGKIHTMTPEQLQKIYPKWNTFLHIREELDPAGLFLNDYLCSLLA